MDLPRKALSLAPTHLLPAQGAVVLARIKIRERLEEQWPIG
jgi:hypothetical protein